MDTTDVDYLKIEVPDSIAYVLSQEFPFPILAEKGFYRILESKLLKACVSGEPSRSLYDLRLKQAQFLKSYGKFTREKLVLIYEDACKAFLETLSDEANAYCKRILDENGWRFIAQLRQYISPAVEQEWVSTVAYLILRAVPESALAS